SKNGLPAHILQGKVDSMGALVNGDSVRVGGKESFADLFQVSATLVEDRNDAALSRNVKTAEGLIKRQHIRVCADGMNGRHFLRVQIKYRQLCILLAGNECQRVLAVDIESVASVATGQGIASDDLILIRI